MSRKKKKQATTNLEISSGSFYIAQKAMCFYIVSLPQL